MYPNLEDNRTSVQFRKTINPSDQYIMFITPSITNAMLQLKNKFNISSFKPHLNYYECHVNLIVNKKLNLPIKMYLFSLSLIVFSSETIPERHRSYTRKSGYNIHWLRLRRVRLYTMISMRGKSVRRWVSCWPSCRISSISSHLWKKVRWRLLLRNSNSINATQSHCDQSPWAHNLPHHPPWTFRTCLRYSNTNRT